ncbi:MAG TPA: sugar transferase [Vicinamibacterales bacterium]
MSSRRRGQWAGRPLVFDEDLFRDLLLREKRRSDRFDQPFVLVLIGLKGGRFCDAPTWMAMIETLEAVKRDTDVLGWFEQGSVLAMILPEVDQAAAQFTREIESRVQVALSRRVDAEVRDDFSIRVHRHAPATARTAGSNHTTDRLLRDLHLSNRARVSGAVKRALDVAASGALLMLASPLFLLIAALVKLKSPGPIFFRQSRVGEHGKLFTMLKFRTMHLHADNAIHKEFVSQLIKGASPEGGDGAKAAPFKIVNDPRVTAIGRLLRKTSLDELPQLWNVFIGEMSLVGPRPPLTYEVEQYKPWHYRRVLEAKPGITGLWQVSGRSRTTFDDMVRLDLRYAKNASAWEDLKILAATPRAVISGKGAC